MGRIEILALVPFSIAHTSDNLHVDKWKRKLSAIAGSHTAHLPAQVSKCFAYVPG